MAGTSGNSALYAIVGALGVVLAGGDSRGLMYAALDTAEKISAAPAANPFQLVRELSETPYFMPVASEAPGGEAVPNFVTH